MLITFLLIPPLIATLISFLMKRNQKLIETVSVASASIQLIASFIISNEVIQSGSYTLSPFFAVDSIGALLILITSIIGIVSVTYNIGYTRQEMIKEIIGLTRVRQTYILINLFLLAMFCAIASTNPILTWISIEATTLSTIFLISFYNKPSATEAAWKYLVINSVGLMLAFLGTIIYLAASAPFIHTELLTWQNMQSVSSSINPNVAKMAFIFVLIGYGTKLGIAPMHTWRPDAYSKAPIPVVAMLSGALLNIAFLAILRFKVVTDNAVGGTFTQSLFIFFGVLSIIIAAFAIFKQENYKRLLAYSSVEHAGLLLLGFGFGGLGVYAGLLHMVYHSLVKSFMFLLSGNIFLKYSSTKIKNITGAIQVLPETGILFIIGFLALTGMPPFGLFLTKFYIILAGINNHLWITIIVISALALIFFGFFRAIVSMMFGQVPEDIKVGEYSKWTLIPPTILLGLIIFLSLALPESTQRLLNTATLSFIK